MTPAFAQFSTYGRRVPLGLSMNTKTNAQLAILVKAVTEIVDITTAQPG